ncbi:MAG: response regulator [Proteobacteria bacterium]|nr:MAG: response regulator [Pseudomonadota bacterium]
MRESTLSQPVSPLILVIDDEEATRYALSWALRQANYRVLESSTGNEGLSLLKESPDLIVLDVMLPDVSGFEVCRIIKANPETASIPVLHMSAAYSTSADKTQGLDLGADAYLIHPVEAPELLATVRALLRIRESEARANIAAKIWKSTFDAIQDGVCLVDDHGVILNGNRALLELVPKWELGTRLQELIPSIPALSQALKAEDIRIGDRWFSYEVSRVETGGMVCTFRDVTERRLAETELLNAKKIAETANLSKSMFLANMSHEIRTPLGAMLGFAGLLKEDSVSEEDKEQYLETIIRNGLNLTLLIDDILDLSKVEAEKMEFEKVPVDIQALLEEVKVSLGILAAPKGVLIETEWSDSVPRVILSDPSRVRQILTNIAGNAVKFTAAGKVSIRVKRLGQHICFEVQDTGRGISEEYFDSLFQPFSQGDSSTTRRFGGTGLGLVLSKQLAKGLGGDVSLLSSRLGSGSTFSITINAEQATLEVKKPAKAVMNVKQFEGLRILVADDSPDNRLLLRRILVRQGIEVAVVENGLEAVQRAHEFDIVLMDIQMPILDGYYATARLRAEGYSGPIIALTAHAMKEEKDRCLAIGCSEYLTKPIDVDLLLKSIARHSAEVSQKTLH